MRDALLLAAFDADLRDVAPALELRFLAPRPALADFRLDAADRPALALRERLDAPRDADADFVPRDFLAFVLPLLALRDEALLPDFLRDFLALVAIDASPRSQ